jgi:hypothetical protein
MYWLTPAFFESIDAYREAMRMPVRDEPSFQSTQTLRTPRQHLRSPCADFRA